jgi:Dolichyl-phosphate-mannose-protein mannosyltransferase
MKTSAPLLNPLHSNAPSRGLGGGFIIHVVLIICVFIAAVGLADPTGNFPLNDDWSYAMAVKRMVESGEFRPTGWTSMTLVSQVMWGALFSLPYGFSFDALRLSTLVLSLTGLIGVYVLVTEVQRSRAYALVAALTLAANPVYFELSCTFMTDVPFTSLSIWASVFFVRALKTQTLVPLLLGTILAIIATLCRQLAVFIPLAFAIAYVARRGMTLPNLMYATLPLVASAGVLIGFQHWLEAVGRVPALAHLKEGLLVGALREPFRFLKLAIKGLLVTSMYLGLFILPPLLFALPQILKGRRGQARPTLVLIAIACAALGTLALNAFDLLMPVGRNVILNSGLGPLTLRGTYVLHQQDIPALPHLLWLAVTAAALFGAIVMWFAVVRISVNIGLSLRSGRMDDLHATMLFFLIGSAIYTFPTLIAGVYDRYLITLVPLLSVCISPAEDREQNFRVRYLASLCVVVLFALFSVLGTKDYFSWNRARWSALDYLSQMDGVNPEAVDGGPEFNGWHLYDETYVESDAKSWWWVKDDKYLLSFQPVNGYGVEKDFPYSGWLPRRDGHIFVLQRESSPADATFKSRLASPRPEIHTTQQNERPSLRLVH